MGFFRYELEVGALAKIFFMTECVLKKHIKKGIFPENTKRIEIILEIDGKDPSDPEASVDIRFCPRTEVGEPIKDSDLYFPMGFYKREEIKEMFTKAVASL